jgi:glutaredoxin
MTIPIVRLYTKPGCHLCEQAEELLDEISHECPLAIEQIDIMTDVDLFERYRYEIPVVAVEGGGSVFGRVTLDDLRRILRLGPPRPAELNVRADSLQDMPKPQPRG